MITTDGKKYTSSVDYPKLMVSTSSNIIILATGATVKGKLVGIVLQSECNNIGRSLETNIDYFIDYNEVLTITNVLEEKVRS